MAFDINKLRAVEDMRREMIVILAKAICRGISEEEAHEIIHEIYGRFC